MAGITPPSSAGSSSGAAVSSSLSGGRPMVATRTAFSNNQAIGNNQGTSRVRHVATQAGSDIRLLYGHSLMVEAPGTNAVQVKVGLEVTGSASALSSGLSTGGAITTLPVLSLGAALPSGTVVTITSGGHTQAWTLSAAAGIGVTSLTVTSQTPNFAYPAASVITMQVVYPVTFAGKATGVIDPNGHLLSDPIPVTLAAGQVFYTRCFSNTPLFNAGSTTSYTPTNASSIVGATSLTAVALIPGVAPGQTVIIDQGGNAESAVLANPAVSGTGPYTYNFATALTKAHASAAVFGQSPLANITLYSDLGEGFVNASDYSWVTTAVTAVAGAVSGVTAGALTAGATKLTLTSSIPANTLLLDTVGSGVQETVTVVNVQGTANPYTYTLAAPLANNHSSGVAAVSDLTNSLGVAPIAIVADKTPSGTTPTSVLIMASDSIAAGTGNPRAGSSFITQALDGKVAYVNTAKAGEAAYQYASDITSPLRRKLITLGKWAFIQDSTNDIYGGQTLAQVQASIQAACLLAKNRGLKVCLTTCLPRTTSTDLWATAANQTIVSSGAQNVVRLAYNAWVRAWQTNGLQGTYVDAAVNLAGAVEANAAGALTQDGGYWYVDPTLGALAADGIHPSQNGHTKLAAAVDTTVFV